MNVDKERHLSLVSPRKKISPVLAVVDTPRSSCAMITPHIDNPEIPNIQNITQRITAVTDVVAKAADHLTWGTVSSNSKTKTVTVFPTVDHSVELEVSFSEIEEAWHYLALNKAFTNSETYTGLQNASSTDALEIVETAIRFHAATLVEQNAAEKTSTATEVMETRVQTYRLRNRLPHTAKG